MRSININISKAQIKSFSVHLEEKEPSVSTTIALITDGGKEISSYSISTQSWNDEDKFELPTELIPPIMTILKTLEQVAVKHCNNNQKQIGG